MGSFHCPMGAVGKGADNCIDCGLCTASTKSEQRVAADIVRNWIRSQSSERLQRYLIQKIAVCGKGGVGKSTITSMLAIALRDMGYEVLVLDMDESNASLGHKLGFSETPIPLLDMVEINSERVKPDQSWLQSDTVLLTDIPDEFICSSNRLHFMQAGKLEDAFSGCACTLSSIATVFLEKLKLEPRQIMIVDNEAGIESFGRGVERYVDTILTVVEPSFESIEMASRIKYMAEGLGISRIRAIVNKVEDSKFEKIVIKKLAEEEVKYLGVMRKDDDISMAGLMGTVVPECPAKDHIEKIAMLMLDEAEMEYTKTM